MSVHIYGKARAHIIARFAPCYAEFMQMLDDIDRWFSEFALEKGSNSEEVTDEAYSIIVQTINGFLTVYKISDVQVVVTFSKVESGIRMDITFKVSDVDLKLGKEYPIAVPL